MFKKLFLIILLIGSYIFIVTTEDKTLVMQRAKKYYASLEKRLKEMHIEVKVNKWVYDKKDRSHRSYSSQKKY